MRTLNLGRGRARKEHIHMTTPQQYVLGFIIDAETDQVLLAYKGKGEVSVHPDKFNGIGGKVLPAELAGMAMVRECKEATGQDFQLGAWRIIGSIVGPVDNRWEVVCYATKQTVKPWLTDAGPNALILTERAQVPTFGLAPHVAELVEQAYRHFAAIDPPKPLTIYDAGGPFK